MIKPKDAIGQLESLKNGISGRKYREAIDLAIFAIQNLEEDTRKQEKDIIIDASSGLKIPTCPTCGSVISASVRDKYCSRCGQAVKRI